MQQMRQLSLLFEIPIFDTPLDAACDWANARQRGEVAAVLMADSSLLLRCRKNTALREACLGASRIYAQDRQVRVAVAMQGAPLQNAAFSAKDLLISLMKSGDHRFFFLGGPAGVARRAAVAVSAAADCKPCPAVGGAPGGFCRKGCENTAVLTRIWECQPDVVAVCLDDGMEWFCQNRLLLPPALYICAPSAAMSEMAGLPLREAHPTVLLRYRFRQYLFYYYAKKQSAPCQNKRKYLLWRSVFERAKALPFAFRR